MKTVSVILHLEIFWTSALCDFLHQNMMFSSLIYDISVLVSFMMIYWPVCLGCADLGGYEAF